MSSSIDWTSPDAYVGRFIPTPPKRSWAAQAIGSLRVAIRRKRREAQSRAEFYRLYQAGSILPDNIRRDIGLPPY
jgi:hypothetical protein